MNLSIDANTYTTSANQTEVRQLHQGQHIGPHAATCVWMSSFLISYPFNQGEPLPTGENVFIEGIHGALIELFVAEGKLFTKIHKLAKAPAPVLMDSVGPCGQIKATFTNAIAGEGCSARGVRA